MYECASFFWADFRIESYFSTWLGGKIEMITGPGREKTQVQDLVHMTLAGGGQEAVAVSGFFGVLFLLLGKVISMKFQEQLKCRCESK